MKPRIQLLNNNYIKDEVCAVSGKEHEAGWPFHFFLNGDYSLPVCVEVALQEGFTMSLKDFEEWNHRAAQAVMAGLPRLAEFRASEKPF